MAVTLSQESERPHVAHLRLDYNDLNLLTVDEADSVRETVASVPDEVSVLTIAADRTGASGDEIRGLSAGLNLEWAQSLSAHEGHDLLRAFYEMIEAVRDLDAVVVCSCGAYTLGAAFELAIACEFRVATADARLGLPEVTVGLPTVIHGGLLLRLAGTQTAAELVYTGKTLSGAEAAERRLVNRAVAPAEYDDALDDLVDSLAAKSPQILRTQKRVLRRFRSLGLERGMEASIGDIGRTFGTPDQREAMAAFLDDREPEFDG
ncbi:enoyl-CoA hydratase/isomerase family protein [Natrinema marinum]|uniref:enoyl-CoA hydratase/isomerase family protein n=1 Tax=Natrinema marinum TaxID=2961598 RepID=UPI0020C86B31|nr:enoyl-CoA hydratase-related protein [Natrinema marinum]